MTTYHMSSTSGFGTVGNYAMALMCRYTTTYYLISNCTWQKAAIDCNRTSDECRSVSIPCIGLTLIFNNIDVIMGIIYYVYSNEQSKAL